MAPDMLPSPGLSCPTCGESVASQSERCDRCGATLPVTSLSDAGTTPLPEIGLFQETAPPLAGDRASLVGVGMQAGSEVILSGDGEGQLLLSSSPGGVSAATETLPARGTLASEQTQPAMTQLAEALPTASALSNETESGGVDFSDGSTLLDDEITDAPEEQALVSEIAVLEGQEPAQRPRRTVTSRITVGVLLRWAPWALGVVGAGVFIGLLITIPSWGSLATWGGVTLLCIGAGAAALVWLARAQQHRWVSRRWFVITASVLLVGILGVALAPVIHLLQGHMLEGQKQYQRALAEYAAGGEHAPDGQDSARTYLEWGQQNVQQQDYGAAVQHLGAAAERYTATPAARQAREPMGKALLLYGQELAREEQFASAIQQFERLRTHYSDTAAARQAESEQDEPAVYFNLGKQLQASQHFQDALAAFQRIGQLFPESFYASQAYTAASSDLYAWSQALIQQKKYDQAIQVDQRNVAQYPQAPAAQQAQQDLSAPQQVSGRLIFTDGTADAKVVIRLSSSWTTASGGYVQGGTVYETQTDSNGNFVFKNIALGTYLIDWQQGTGFTTLLHQGTYNPVYLAIVQPLRGTNVGDVQIPAQG
jgi:outer membrane protein assembly factor BamD (BamD/ComL family)